MELLVRDDEPIEEGIDQIGGEAGNGTAFYINDMLFLANLLRNMGQSPTHDLEFLPFAFGTVKVEAFHVDIGLGHHKSESCIEVQSHTS